MISPDTHGLGCLSQRMRPSKLLSNGKLWWKIDRVGRSRVKLRTDNGLEFCKEEFNQFCANKGIGRHHTIRMTPQ